jgi:hypothetical protein
VREGRTPWYAFLRRKAGTTKGQTMRIRISDIAHRCDECGKTWRVWEDAEQWAYGHDCADES